MHRPAALALLNMAALASFSHPLPQAAAAAVLPQTFAPSPQAAVALLRAQFAAAAADVQVAPTGPASFRVSDSALSVHLRLAGGEDAEMVKRQSFGDEARPLVPA